MGNAPAVGGTTTSFQDLPSLLLDIPDYTHQAHLGGRRVQCLASSHALPLQEARC